MKTISKKFLNLEHGSDTIAQALIGSYTTQGRKLLAVTHNSHGDTVFLTGSPEDNVYGHCENNINLPAEDLELCPWVAAKNHLPVVWKYKGNITTRATMLTDHLGRLSDELWTCELDIEHIEQGRIPGARVFDVIKNRF